METPIGRLLRSGSLLKSVQENSVYKEPCELKEK